MADASLINALRAQIAEASAAADSSTPPKAARKSRRRPQNSLQGSDSDVDSPDSADTSNDPQAAYERLQACINLREHSQTLMRSKLIAKGFTENAVDKAIERAVKNGLIDDARFAEVLIWSRIRQGRGLQGIERELLKSGIDPSKVEGWPDAFTEGKGDEVDRALEYIRLHPSRSKSLREGAYRKLISKGYSPQSASQASRIWASEQ